MKAWTTQYRPRKFADLQLTDVREQMLELQKNASFPQVLLFAGPKGTGKTSTARILAATLNAPANSKLVDEIYLQEDKADKKATGSLADPDWDDPAQRQILQGNSYAVVEIDAASHRGIDDVRALQEQAYLPPSMSKMLVYILDEVHMFTSEAFNALLKILEEPPRHAIFILATTEDYKIPATVKSRCRVVNFRQATTAEIQEVCERIAKAEKLQVEPEAVAEIARLSEGSFRDGVKMLQTVAGGEKKVTLERVHKLLVGGQQEQIEQLLQIVMTKDSQQLVDFFDKLRQQQTNESFWLKNLYHFLYEQLVANINGQKVQLNDKQARFLLSTLLATGENYSPIAFLPVELQFLEIFEQAKKQKK
ncbi:DNA polymerase III subunit gamma/tau [bacterium]|nr:DNA polymerase III subunit gamma/tau [bacterium]